MQNKQKKQKAYVNQIVHTVLLGMIVIKIDVYWYQWTKPHELGQKREKDERA